MIIRERLITATIKQLRKIDIKALDFKKSIIKKLNNKRDLKSRVKRVIKKILKINNKKTVNSLRIYYVKLESKL